MSREGSPFDPRLWGRVVSLEQPNVEVIIYTANLMQIPENELTGEVNKLHNDVIKYISERSCTVAVRARINDGQWFTLVNYKEPIVIENISERIKLLDRNLSETLRLKFSIISN